MDVINSIINFFKNINDRKLLDITIAVVVIILFCLLSSLIAYGIIKIFKWKKRGKDIKENLLYKPIQAFVIWIGIYIAVLVLGLPSDVMDAYYVIFRIGIIIILAIGISNMFAPNSKIFRKIGKNKKLRGNKTLINFISKITRVIMYIIAGFLIMAELHYDLGGLIAGLGLSGVIVALGAQDLAKNLFGGLAIILDKPFVVGDWIETPNYSGIVEDITFRSTRIRTFDNTLVTIQNSTLSNEPVTNYAKMRYRRFTTILNLALETNTDAVEDIINKLKFVLTNTENVVPESLKVVLLKIADDGIEIEIFLNTNVTEYNDYLEFSQDINLLILKILESEEVKLAYPTQNVYVRQSEQ